MCMDQALEKMAKENCLMLNKNELSVKDYYF